MALNRNSTYGQRWAVPDADDEQGSYKNKSDPTDTQASYLEANVLNDSFSGLQGAFLANKHANNDGTGAPTGYVDPTDPSAPTRFNASGVQDTAQASQVYNEWYKKTQDIVDAKIAEMQKTIDGAFFQYFNRVAYGDTNADFEILDLSFGNSNVSNVNYTLNSSNITLESDGGLTFDVSGTYFFQYVGMEGDGSGEIKIVKHDDSIEYLAPTLCSPFHLSTSSTETGYDRVFRIGVSGDVTLHDAPTHLISLAIAVDAGTKVYIKMKGTMSNFNQINFFRVGAKTTITQQPDLLSS